MKSTPRVMGGRWHSKLRAIIGKMMRSNRGSVAIEVVIIVPLILFTLIGFNEMYMYMRAVSLVEHTAFTLADSIGQMAQVIDDESTSSGNNLGSLWQAATFLSAPNALQAQGGVIITSVCEQTTSCIKVPRVSQSLTTGQPVILWQAQAPWTMSSMQTQVTTTNILPASWPFRTGDSAVVVEVFYSYNPFPITSNFWANAPGVQTIYERVYVTPRLDKALPLCPPNGCP